MQAVEVDSPTSRALTTALPPPPLVYSTGRRPLGPGPLGPGLGGAVSPTSPRGCPPQAAAAAPPPALVPIVTTIGPTTTITIEGTITTIAGAIMIIIASTIGLYPAALQRAWSAIARALAREKPCQPLEVEAMD